MPRFVTMAFSHHSDQPGGNAGGAKAPRMEPSVADEAPVRDGITPERLQRVIKRLDSGFYDTPEVREEIARRVRKELES